jgi:L-lactate dehydrogenase complex protein LldF
VLADWAGVLERLADQVLASGGHVCWAPDGAAANAYIAEVARRRGARRAVKSKSMATEETGLNEALAAVGCEVTETDLGEWIIQLAGEHPSHLIAPAVHRNRHQIADTFQAEAGMADRTTEPADLVAFARRELRRRFLEADLGISGANLGVAETGSVVLVTNEGNGRLVTSLPPVHVAVMGAERVVDTWEQADLVLGLLAKAATGQPLTSYTSILTGPRRPGEVDGPDEFHLVVLDNGRSDLAGTELAEMLNCIRCGACLNVCPVYRQTGGHAYGWVYSGPMGAVLTPLLAGDEPHAAELAGASSLCGACMEACPVEIPLQDLLLALRRRKAPHAGLAERAMWRAWAAAWSRPAAYRASAWAATRSRRLVPVLGRLPGPRRWTATRRLPALPPRTFTERWRAGEP